MKVKIHQFGRDHWSLLAYIECCCVEHQPLDKRKLRCNSKKRPIHNVNGFEWGEGSGTRLRGYDPRRNKKKNFLPSHDDWDCLDDLEAAMLIKTTSEMNAIVELTPLGINLSHLIRKHKIAGGNIASFLPPEVPTRLAKKIMKNKARYESSTIKRRWIY